MTFVRNFNEKAESFGRFQIESIGDVLTEIFGSGARVDFKRFICVIRKINLVEYLGRLVLDCFHLHLVWRVFPTSTPAKWQQQFKKGRMATVTWIFSLLQIWIHRNFIIILVWRILVECITDRVVKVDLNGEVWEVGDMLLAWFKQICAIMKRVIIKLQGTSWEVLHKFASILKWGSG